MNVEPLHGGARWWRIGTWEVDLRARNGTYPPNVRACALLHRDATTDQDHDLAAVLAAQVDTGDTTPLAAIGEWLYTRSQVIYHHARRIPARTEGTPRDPAA